VDTERIKRIVELLKSSPATELTVREGDTVIRVRRPALGTANPLSVAEEQAACGDYAAQSDNGSATQDNNDEIYEVRTHLVGYFHDSRQLGGPPLVKVGQKVEEGQVVGTIEALRRLTEVVSPVTGEVIAKEVEDGDAVQYGDVLMRIRKTSGADDSGQ